MADKLEFEWSDLKTITNMLSISRLILIPALVVPFVMEDESLTKIIFLVMFITNDHVDENTRSIFKDLKGPFQYK